MPVSVEYYKDKATECCKKAASASDAIDKQGWTRLALAWVALVELQHRDNKCRPKQPNP
jgi:hypothetical protein